MKRIFCIGDAHDGPGMSKARFYWMGREARAYKPDAIFQIGDVCNFDSLCKYVANDSWEGKFKPGFDDDLRSLDAALTAFTSGLGKFTGKKHLTLGNHEDRVWSFGNRNPEVYGTMTTAFTELLTKHGWTYSEFGKIVFYAGIGFVHIALNGLRRPYGGKMPETQIANDLTHDIVMGHLHKPKVIRVPKVGDNQHITVVNLGCSLPEGHVESYAKHGLTGWGYGIMKLREWKRRIQDWEFVSMKTLKGRWG